MWFRNELSSSAEVSLYYVIILCVFLLPCVLFYWVCIAVLHILDAGLLARSQYSEGPATGHLDTGFSLFPCVYKQMLRWFPRLQVATTCFSCSSPDLNLLDPIRIRFILDPYFIFMYVHYNRCHRLTAHLQTNIIIIIILLLLIRFGLHEAIFRL